MIGALTGIFKRSQSQTETESATNHLARPLAVIDDIPTNYSRQDYCLEHLHQHGRGNMIGKDILNRPGMVPIKNCEESRVLLMAVQSEWDNRHQRHIVEWEET